MTSESNLLFWRLEVAFLEKKITNFDDLGGTIKKMSIQQHGPRHKLTKLHNYGHKIPRRFAQADKDDNKAHPLMIKWAMYNNICLPFYLFLDLSCSNDYGVPGKFAQATQSSRPLLCDVTLAVINRLQTNT